MVFFFQIKKIQRTSSTRKRSSASSGSKFGNIISVSAGAFFLLEFPGRFAPRDGRGINVRTTIATLALALVMAGCSSNKPLEQPPQGVQAQAIDHQAGFSADGLWFSAERGS